MAYDLVTCSQFTVHGRIVQGTQQLRRGSNLIITEGTELIGHLSRKKRKHLSVLLIQTQEARRTTELLRLQVAQDAVHEA